MKATYNLMSKMTAYLVAALMMFIVVMVLWQVFSRYVLMSPSAGSDEVSRFLLIWLGLLGSTYCYQQNSHLSLDILARKLSPKRQADLARFVHLVVFVFSLLVLVVGGINLVMTTLNPIQLSAVLGIKMAYVYVVMPLTGVVFCTTAIKQFLSIRIEQFMPQKAGE